MTKLRPLGNRRAINVGGLIFNIRESSGSLKMASEFFIADSNTQLNLLEDWINALENMYNAEIKQEGALRERLSQRKPRPLRQYEG
jgi:hypothetical protein